MQQRSDRNLLQALVMHMSVTYLCVEREFSEGRLPQRDEMRETEGKSMNNRSRGRY